MDEIRFDIIKHLGIINDNSNGWTRELNLVSWNGKAAKYDIREWAPDHRRMGKGLTFTEEEFRILKSIIFPPVRQQRTPQFSQEGQTESPTSNQAHQAQPAGGKAFSQSQESQPPVSGDAFNQAQQCPSAESDLFNQAQESQRAGIGAFNQAQHSEEAQCQNEDPFDHNYS